MFEEEKKVISDLKNDIKEKEKELYYKKKGLAEKIVSYLREQKGNFILKLCENTYILVKGVEFHMFPYGWGINNEDVIHLKGLLVRGDGNSINVGFSGGKRLTVFNEFELSTEEEFLACLQATKEKLFNNSEENIEVQCHCSAPLRNPDLFLVEYKEYFPEKYVETFFDLCEKYIIKNFDI